MKGLSLRWQKVVVWLTGYLNIVAFIIAGGYFYQKTEHEEVKRSAIIALFVTAVFTAIDVVRLFILYCLNLGSASTSWLTTTYTVLQIIKILVFVVLFIVDMTVGFGKTAKDGAKEDAAAEEEAKSDTASDSAE